MRVESGETAGLTIQLEKEAKPEPIPVVEEKTSAIGGSLGLPVRSVPLDLALGALMLDDNPN